jgi:signal transduction histidine kinase
MRDFSITTRLSLAFYSLLILVIAMGAASLSSLNQFNAGSAQIRERWLPSTRLLGDLNNYTSDFRAAEGTMLLSSQPGDLAAGAREFADLDRAIATARDDYAQMPHGEKENDLFLRFTAAWDKYRKTADRIHAAARAGRLSEGIALYKTTSKAAYDAASDTLGLLTELNVVLDKEASERAAAAYERARDVTLFAMSACLLMVVLVVASIRRSLSRPMLELAGVMHKLAKNTMDVEISGTGRGDEIGEMARAVVVFRNNAVELALSREGIERQAAMLSEKLRHERHLLEAQGNFISTASHEFRTPLNIIDGHAQRLAKAKDTSEVAERAGRVRAAVKQMIELIDNLINGARLFEGKPELYFHPAAIDLAPLLREICGQYRELVPEAEIAEKVAGPLPVSGDAGLLRQVFGNLLSNAVKYSPEGVRIEVGAKPANGEVAVTVRDRGIGIPEKDRETIFDRYVRGSNVRGIAGSGIGLALARLVVELHGGRIAVDSAEGQGAVFSVILPARA